MSSAPGALAVRWLGRVPYREALALQRALHGRSARDHLLLLEHPHVYTLGRAANVEHLLVPPAGVGAELERADRGGDVTYHGPGQLVGYPILTLPEWRDGLRDVVAYVRRLEDTLVAALTDLGIRGAGREPRLTGVWVDGEKVAAIGVRVARGRTMHGFALNVDPDLTMFSHIVPCGIRDRGVTSVRRLAGRPVEMRTVVDAVTRRLAEVFGYPEVERADVVWHERPSDLSAFSRRASATTPVTAERLPEGRRNPGCGVPGHGAAGRQPGNGTNCAPETTTTVAAGAQNRGLVSGGEPGGRPDLPDAGRASATDAGMQPAKPAPQPVRLLGRLAEAGVAPPEEPAARRPEWMRVRARLGPDYQDLKEIMRGLDLHTVCEEAGCPNIYECWAERTATFMILGERCTRACGFCLVDTRRPLPLDPAEPDRVAEAVGRMGLAHAVVTSVARDDLPDGGAAGFAATIAAIRAAHPATTVEVLIPDCKGDEEALGVIFAARPDVLNHNLETVARLQRAARPSAGYARSLGVLARAKDAGLTTKSGLILGMGETAAEVRSAIADLAAVGVDVLTIGQYLRPTAQHLPVVKWWHPDEFAELGDYARRLGFSHVESGPLVRSSYHARRAVEGAGLAVEAG